VDAVDRWGRVKDCTAPFIVKRKEGSALVVRIGQRANAVNVVVVESVQVERKLRKRRSWREELSWQLGWEWGRKVRGKGAMQDRKRLRDLATEETTKLKLKSASLSTFSGEM